MHSLDALAEFSIPRYATLVWDSNRPLQRARGQGDDGVRSIGWCDAIMHHVENARLRVR